LYTHTDKLNERTYSIKVGKNIPPNGVNLAYVDSEDLMPEKNMDIMDYSDKKQSSVVEMVAEPKQDFVLYSVVNNNSYLPTQNIDITDEFSIKENPGDDVVPLYYRTTLSKPFSMSNFGIIKNPGYTDRLASSLKSDPELIPAADDLDLIYIGDKMKVTNNGAAVPPNSYKAALRRLDNNRCEIDLYTSFRNTTANRYQVTYQSTSGSVTENLNVYKFFNKDDDLISQLLEATNGGNMWDPRLNSKTYTVREQDGKYQVFAPTHMIVANKDTRPTQKFRYKIEGNVQVRHSIEKPCTINVGLLYLNTQPGGVPWVNAENISDIFVKLYKHPYLPSYVNLDNPHRPYSGIGSGAVTVNEKDNPNYWLVNLDSPEEMINDYDVIVITGYGQYDISGYNYMLRKFLEHGGSLWLDNGGDGITAFAPAVGSNKFVVDVSFSDNVLLNNNSPKVIEDITNKSFTRVWALNEDTALGYNGINPKIIFGAMEEEETWHTIVKYDNDNPCIIEKSFFERGTVIVSNCGIMRAVHSSEGDDVRFVINSLLRLKENKWIRTPWLNTNVLNIETLFTNEFEQGKEGYYQEGYHVIDNTTKVAKKLLHSSVISALRQYNDVEDDIVSGNYFLYVEQLQENENHQIEYLPTANIYSYPLGSMESPVYVYTLLGGGDNTTNITSDMLKRGRLKVYYEPMDITYTIYAFKYIWDGRYKRYAKEYKASKTYQRTISKQDGVANLGIFEHLIPDMATDMADTGKVFFEVSMSYIDPNGNMRFLDVPANIKIYNSKTGEFVYDTEGNSVISYMELYDSDNAQYIRLYAWTDYQTIAANTRRFAVKAFDNESIYVTRPFTINEADPWYVRVRNGSYKVTESNRQNAEMEMEYMYEIPEYVNQVFNPGIPYMKVINEKARYIDYHHVSLGNGDLFVDRGEINGEILDIFTERVYKTAHSSITPIYADDGTLISPVVYDDNGPINIVDIDYEYGIVTLQQDHVGALRINYSWNNLSVYKRKYGKFSSQREELTRLDFNTFKTKNHPIVLNPIPTIYMKDAEGNIKPLPSDELYTIDYENGIVSLENSTAYPVYMSYTHSTNEPLDVIDYDAINGILTIKQNINFADEVFVTYHCEQKFYEYKGYMSPDGVFVNLDMNPSEGHTFMYNNKLSPTSSIISKTIYIYMLPRAIRNLTYYCKVPNSIVTLENGKPVVNLIQESDAWDTMIQPTNLRPDQLSYIPYRYLQNNLRLLTGDISSNPEGKLNDALLPDSGKTSPYIDSTMGLVPTVMYESTEPGMVIIGGYIINNWVIRHTFDNSELNDIVENTAGAKLLAKVKVKETDFNITVIDARQPGGGIKKAIPYETIRKRNGAINLSYWDISTWDGIAYQKNGTVVITLPRRVLKEYGGQFTKTQVNEYIKQYMALGVYFIVEYVDIPASVVTAGDKIVGEFVVGQII
jgi:hypothetical protein